MKKKIRIIFWVCTAAVVISALWSLVRTLRPSRGKPYERLSVQEALEYMSFEPDYCILDVRSSELYEKGHITNALNLPANNIVHEAEEIIEDKNQMIYVYGQDEEESCMAAQKLSDMGFTSVSEIGCYEDLKIAIDA